MSISTAVRLFSSSLLLGAVTVAQCHDLDGVTAVVEQFRAQYPLTGNCSIQVEQSGVVRYQQQFGAFGPDTVVPIASATKTLSAAVLLSLVDDGLLALDDRVSTYLPEWDSGVRRFITLRQCFTHTSGLPANSPWVTDDTITLRQAAAELAAEPLGHLPGAKFEYGNVSMHVAGAVCEVVAGQPWSTLFEQRIATPLGMDRCDYYAFGLTANPLIAGGARCDLSDYAAFVAMLRRRGVHAGAAVLAPGSVDTMLSDQTSGLPIVATPHPNEAPYGIGIWLDRRAGDGRTLLASGAGAFGFQGWVDRAHDASGVFLAMNSASNTYPYVERIWSVVDDALLPAGVACAGFGSPVCASEAWLNASGPAVAGDVGFAIRCSQAPPGALGGLFLGGGITGGAPVFDLQSFVDGSAALVDVLLADGDGRAVLPAPLAAVAPGATFAMQAVWFSGEPCTQLGLQASHALVVTVQ